jgi:hypothetical protein
MGFSPIDKVFKIPEQVPFDFLHLVLQGHAKWLLNKLFIDKAKNDLFRRYDETALNYCLKSIRLPHTFNRKPSKIDEALRWKSSEIKIFLFYESVPILIKYLSSAYFYKYASYVIAVRLLYEPIRDIQCLSLIKDIFIHYIKDLEETFSIEACTYTIHAHLHLVDQVKLHGPLHCHSQFAFEGALFNLKNILHGTRGYLNQLSKQIFLSKEIGNKITNEYFQNDILLARINQIFNKSHKIRIDHLLGSIQKRKPNEKEKKIFNDKYNLNLSSKEVLIGERLVIKKRLFYSKLYKKKGQYDSFSVCYNEGDNLLYGQIEYFIEIESKFYAYINLIQIKDNLEEILPKSHGIFYTFVKKFFISFFQPIDFTKSFDLIDCSSIENRCIIINNQDLMFITRLLYEYEHD